jgi:glycosyltransferase involved in cell wall biosynthesis
MTSVQSSNHPVVSVVLPVYNGATYLKESIESILKQSFSNFELIIINDGSTDDSAEIITSFTDRRIKYIAQKNHGLAKTLNRGIALAKGKYIARQDQDDRSFPTRLAKQVTHLESHPDCGLVGTWATIWEETTDTGKVHRHPADDLTLRFELLFDNPFVHSSVMLRKTVFKTVGLYSTDPDRQPPEDYELWSRVVQKYQVANLPEVLHLYRGVKHGMSRDKDNPFLPKVIRISVENIARQLNRKPTDPQVMALATLAHCPFKSKSLPPLDELVDLFNQLVSTFSTEETSSNQNLKKSADVRLAQIRYNYPKSKLIQMKNILDLKIKLLKKAR